MADLHDPSHVFVVHFEDFGLSVELTHQQQSPVHVHQPHLLPAVAAVEQAAALSMEGSPLQLPAAPYGDDAAMAEAIALSMQDGAHGHGTQNSVLAAAPSRSASAAGGNGNEAIIQQLMDMLGVSRDQATFAVEATGGSSIEAAAELCL